MDDRHIASRSQPLRLRKAWSAFDLTRSSGVGALRVANENAVSGASVTRVSAAPETAVSFATRNAPTPLDRVKSKALQAFLRRRGWDLEAMCLSFIGYEGSADHVAAQRKLSERIAKRHGGPMHSPPWRLAIRSLSLR